MRGRGSLVVMAETRRHTRWLAIVLVTIVLFVGAVCGSQAGTELTMGAARAAHVAGHLTGHDDAIPAAGNPRVSSHAPAGSAAPAPADSALRAAAACARLRTRSGIPAKAIIAPMRT